MAIPPKGCQSKDDNKDMRLHGRISFCFAYHGKRRGKDVTQPNVAQNDNHPLILLMMIRLRSPCGQVENYLYFMNLESC